MLYLKAIYHHHHVVRDTKTIHIPAAPDGAYGVTIEYCSEHDTKSKLIHLSSNKIPEIVELLEKTHKLTHKMKYTHAMDDEREIAMFLLRWV